MIILHFTVCKPKETKHENEFCYFLCRSEIFKEFKEQSSLNVDVNIKYQCCCHFSRLSITQYNPAITVNLYL